MDEYLVQATASSEIITTRNVIGSIETVFKAWTDPLHLRTWWGPKRFSNTFIEFNCKPGGKWIFIMHGPGKNEYLNECEFIEVVPDQLVAWNHLSDPPFLAVASFKQVTRNITNVTYTMRFSNADACAEANYYPMLKTDTAFDRLEDELEHMEPKAGTFRKF